MSSLCSALAPVPLCLCPGDSPGASLCHPDPRPISCSCPSPTSHPVPVALCLCFQAAAVPGQVPLHFWSVKMSWPLERWKCPQKVGAFLGSALGKGIPRAWRSGLSVSIQGSIFTLLCPHVCSYLCPQKRSTVTESAPEYLTYLAPTDTRGGFACGAEEALDLRVWLDGGRPLLNWGM